VWVILRQERTKDQTQSRGDGATIDTGVTADGGDNGSGRLDWSPDGTQIVYDDYLEIWIMNVRPPHDPVKLTSSQCGDYWPSWSPDGTRIAYRGTC